MSNNNCGHGLGCGCKESFLTTPPACPTPVDCPDQQPCSEVFPAECINYSGPDILCNLDVVVAQNTSIAVAITNIITYFCGLGNDLFLQNDLYCPESPIIAPAGTPVNTALELLTDYICTGLPITAVVAGDNIVVTENTVGTVTTYTVNGLETIVEAGDGIDVAAVTVGNTTTYTVATESPILKKFIYEETLPSGNVNQDIFILYPNYTSCNLPTIGCDGTSTTLPEVTDIIIQGYWFSVDLNYWVEFTHADKTKIFIDGSGNILLSPVFSPAPSDLDLAVRIRITIIG